MRIALCEQVLYQFEVLTLSLFLTGRENESAPNNTISHLKVN